MNTLFSLGNFTSASGRTLSYKIECDSLDDSSWECLAYIGSRILTNMHITFGKVMSVPTGGDKLAKYMEKYITSNSNTILVVDDVYTTGNSIRKYMLNNENYVGLVAFAREPINENNVHGIWQLSCWA